MDRAKLTLTTVCLIALNFGATTIAADFDFYGRSGDAIEINLASLPGVAAGSTFSSLNISGFSGHTVLTSDTLSGQAFASAGRLWVFPNPARNTSALGDTDATARGFQGSLSGSLLINGVSKTFRVAVQPGYTGNGKAAVGQNLEKLGGTSNTPLFVAQQQQRLRYFSFVRSGGATVAVNGTFDAATDEATRTFQAAFVGGVNTTQDDADGIIGPITAGWLNASNAPTWEKLVDPDPQPAGTFSVSRLTGNFDILPGPDPSTGSRTGNTPQPESWGTSWAIDLIKLGSAKAKLATGRTQMVNAMSMSDGYGSGCCHDTHKVGMDIDLHTDSSTWDYGNGSVDSEEQKAIQHAIAFISSGSTAGVARILTSNQDILGGINAQYAGRAVYDSSGVHLNHMHIDVAVPTKLVDAADLAGDFNLDNVVDARDFIVWRDGLGATYKSSDYTAWKANFGRTASSASAVGSVVPEPTACILFTLGGLAITLQRKFRSARHLPARA